MLHAAGVCWEGDEKTLSVFDPVYRIRRSEIPSFSPWGESEQSTTHAVAQCSVSAAHSLVAVLYFPWFVVHKNTLSMVVEIFGSCCSSIG